MGFIEARQKRLFIAYALMNTKPGITNPPSNSISCPLEYYSNITFWIPTPSSSLLVNSTSQHRIGHFTPTYYPYPAIQKR